MQLVREKERKNADFLVVFVVLIIIAHGWGTALVFEITSILPGSLYIVILLFLSISNHHRLVV